MHCPFEANRYTYDVSVRLLQLALPTDVTTD